MLPPIKLMRRHLPPPPTTLKVDMTVTLQLMDLLSMTGVTLLLMDLQSVTGVTLLLMYRLSAMWAAR